MSGEAGAAGNGGTVDLFVSCMVDLFRPQAAVAALRLLERRGFRVRFPERQTCCGQFAFNAGHDREAAELGRRLVAAFEEAGDAAPVVALSGSCAAMVRAELPGLLEREARERGESGVEASSWGERARRLAGRVVELSEFLERVGAEERETGEDGPPRAPAGREAPLRVAYHNGCHMRRLLGVREAPLRALERAGVEAEEPPAADQCCGFGGTFSLVEPSLAAVMADAKLAQVAEKRREGAAALVSADLGCLLHLGGRLRRRGDPWPVVHLAELLELAEEGRLDPAALASASALPAGAPARHPAPAVSATGGEEP
ncbi:MAG: (Fe-S)-binding protein [Bacillota bacterium]|nr:(Fe-S)-binding protein [Bacillota bacterium]MDI3318001.1 (Fe-S)-binding protein [Bacillota bacterium]